MAPLDLVALLRQVDAALVVELWVLRTSLEQFGDLLVREVTVDDDRRFVHPPT
jgi:hypothetical protein